VQSNWLETNSLTIYTMDEITAIIEIVQNIGFVGLLVVLAIPKLRRLVFNGNGNSKELKEIRENHLEHIATKLDKIIDIQTENAKGIDKVLFILEREHERK